MHKLAAEQNVDRQKIFLWVDYHSVDQHGGVSQGVNALPLYIQCCDAFVTIHHEEYWTRAWCLSEALFGEKARAKRSFPAMYVLKDAGLSVAQDTSLVDEDQARAGRLTDERDRPKIDFLATQSNLL